MSWRTKHMVSRSKRTATSNKEVNSQMNTLLVANNDENDATGNEQ